MTESQSETQPSFDGLTRAVVQQPVYGLLLAYQVPAPSPHMDDSTGEAFVPLDYLARYAGEDKWTDWGEPVFETDPVLRSAMLDSGLAQKAFLGDGDDHLRRTEKFVNVWNALFADLTRIGTLKFVPGAPS